MNRHVDITDRKEISRLLSLLDSQTVPLWGKMKAQQMVEHLIEQVRYTNGKLIPFCELPAVEAFRRKKATLYSDEELPRNVVLGTLPETTEFNTLKQAAQVLLNELADFDQYFSKPGQTAIHGSFGTMNHNEWLVWHGKHFTHHFKQFKLIV